MPPAERVAAAAAAAGDAVVAVVIADGDGRLRRVGDGEGDGRRRRAAVPEGDEAAVGMRLPGALVRGAPSEVGLAAGA